MSAKTEGISSNARRLLWGGFLAILAAGVGFAIRGGILDTWKAIFHFSDLQNGLINGAGFTGFCFGIVIGGVIADKIGYGKLVIVAFALHIASALVTFSVNDGTAEKTAFALLWTGTFIFAVANGTLEAVANPLVATLFPTNRTHYLNILHASWPAGMILGGLAVDQLGIGQHWTWKAQLALFLIPVAIYGLMFLGQKFPKSEASEKGLSLGQMLKDVGIIGSAVIAFFIFLFVKDGLGPLLNGFTSSDFFVGETWKYISIGIGGAVWLTFSGLSGFAIGSTLLFTLFIAHALVGAVELGTDGWIQSISGAILTKSDGAKLFTFTSALMFLLRFCAHFIEKTLKFSPVALLFTCAMIACAGLNVISAVNTFGTAMGAMVIYALGKTFFWPTMLAVASDRFPRTGAVAISIMGGIGMMSAGLIGSAGLGYANDRFSAAAVPEKLKAEYIGAKESQWLVFESVKTIDASKFSAVKEKLGKAQEENDKKGVNDPKAALTALNEKETSLHEATITGARHTLRADSIIPATMAVIYLLILLYFKSIGGYKPIHIDDQKA
jgi:MFS family permease